MRAQRLPAIAGWHWITAGYAIYRRHPAMLLLLVTFYWIVLLFIDILPLIGPIAASIAVPGLSVGVMNACRDLDKGKTVPPGTLFSGFRQRLRPLIVLGVLYLVLTISILLASAAIDGGEMMRYLLSGQRPNPAGVEGGALLAPLVLIGLVTPLLMAYWYAPMLTAWQDLPPRKALFFSFIACCLNWRAFVTYGAIVLLLCIFGPFFLLLLGAAFSQEAAGIVSAFLALPLLMVVMPVIFASFYASYRDVFEHSEHSESA